MFLLIYYDVIQNMIRHFNSPFVPFYPLKIHKSSKLIKANYLISSFFLLQYTFEQAMYRYTTWLYVCEDNHKFSEKFARHRWNRFTIRFEYWSFTSGLDCCFIKIKKKLKICFSGSGCKRNHCSTNSSNIISCNSSKSKNRSVFENLHSKRICLVISYSKME